MVPCGIFAGESPIHPPSVLLGTRCSERARPWTPGPAFQCSLAEHGFRVESSRADSASKHKRHPMGDHSLASCRVRNSAVKCSRTEVVQTHTRTRGASDLGHRVSRLVPGTPIYFGSKG